MSNKIGNDYIDNAINKLVAVLGVKEKINPTPLFNDLVNEKIKECIKKIAVYLGLPIEIDLSYVSDDYKQSISGEGFSMGEGGSAERFDSSALVETNDVGEGSEGITAQVLIPQDLPFFGSSRLNGYPIKVKISKNCLNHHKTFIAMMSHELSHILLKSIASKEADNEIYTDITPLILGFSDFIWDGRKTSKTTSESGLLQTTYTTHTTTYGYLNDNQFNYAYKKISRILEGNIYKKDLLLTEIQSFEKKHKLYEKCVNLYKDSLKLIKSNDDEITALSSPSLLDDIDLFNNKNKERLEKLKKYHSSFTHYTKHNTDVLNKNTENTSTFVRELKDKITLIKKNIKILAGYNNFFIKLKMNIRYFGLCINPFN